MLCRQLQAAKSTPTKMRREIHNKTMTGPVTSRDFIEVNNASATRSLERECDISSVNSYARDSDAESVKSKASNVAFLDVFMRVEDLVQQTRRQHQQSQQQQTRNLGGSSSGSLGGMSSLGGASTSIVSSTTMEGLFAEDSLTLASQRKGYRRRQHAHAGRSRSDPKIGNLNLFGETEDSLFQTQLRVPTLQRRNGNRNGDHARDTWQEDLSDDGSFAVPMSRPSVGVQGFSGY
jgi:hypothetical protein